MLLLTSYFNNFGAEKYNILSTKFITNKELIKNSNIKFEDHLIIFGNYEVDYANHSIIDYPNLNNKNIDSQFLHNWGLTIDNIFLKYRDLNNQFIITLELLSNIEDPRPLLLAIKKLMLHNHKNKLIILLHKINQYYRIWNKNQLIDFLKNSGFIVNINNNNLFLSIDIEHYKKYLSILNFDANILELQMIILSNQNSTDDYLKSIQKNSVLLSVDLDKKISYAKNTISPYIFNKNYNYENFVEGIGIIEVVKCVLYLLPNIKGILFYDNLHLAFRITQARNSGVLPLNIKLNYLLIDSIDYNKFLLKDDTNYEFNELRDIVKENYIFNNIDEVYMLNNNIYETLSNEFGYNFKKITLLNNNCSLKNFIYSQNNLKQIINQNIINDITIGIPIYNTNLLFINELIYSINNLIIYPFEVLFIDDGSDLEYSKELKQLIAQNIKIKYRIITQNNLGLSGARNTALNNTQTKYLMVIDSDDLFLPSTLIDCWLNLELNTHLVLTMGFFIYFKNNDYINYLPKIVHGENIIKVLGTNLAKAIGLYKNEYPPSACMLNINKIISITGWDDTNKYQWEDWAFYNKIAWSGYQFNIIPYLGVLYRIHAKSMSRTYSKYLGNRKVIASVPIITKLDMSIIKGLMSINLTRKEEQLIHIIRKFRKNKVFSILSDIVFKFFINKRK